MRWFQFLMQWFVAFLMMWTPFAVHAQANPTAAVSGWSAAPPATNPFLDISFQSSENGTRAVHRQSSGAETIIDLPHTPEKQLRTFSPRTLEIALRKMKAAGAGKAALKHATMNFPREAFMFFLAIGGVTALQLFSDSGANPVRMEQHIDHSISPVGMMSFYAFMYANGYASNILNAVVKNPKNRHYIPYLSMTAGFFVQTMISTVAADPLIQACVKSLTSGKTDNMGQQHPCEQAFSFYVINKHINNLAPGLVSMLVSTAVAGISQRTAASLAIKTGHQVSTWGAALASGSVGQKIASLGVVKIGLMVTRAGIALTGAGLVVNFLQMAVFYWLDVGFLNPFIMWRWKNVSDGVGLANRQMELVSLISEKKTSGWADKSCTKSTGWIPFFSKKEPADCDYDLAEPLRRFQEQASEWRMTNLGHVYEAHHGWQTKLGRLTGQYQATYMFYRDLVSEIRNSRFGTDSTSIKRLEYAYPLVGVEIPDFDSEKKDLHYVQPQRLNYEASQHVKMSGLVIDELLGRQEFADMHGLNSAHVEMLRKFVPGLMSGDSMTQGRTLLEMKKALETISTSSPSSPLRRALVDLLKLMGRPEPTFERGRGFLYSFEQYSSEAAILSTTGFPTIVGGFQTPRPTEYLLMQTVCGPDADAGEAIVKEPFGMASEFHPPRLVSTGSTVSKECNVTTAVKPPSAIFQTPYTENGVRFSGILDYVKKNLRPQVMGTTDDEPFVFWWENVSEKQMKEAYDRYARQYDGIVKNLLTALWRKDNSFWNSGPMANGIVDSTRQQIRLNLTVLGEMLKDIYRAQQGAALPLGSRLFSSRPEPRHKAPKALITAGALPLLAALTTGGTGGEKTCTSETTVFEWNNLAKAYPQSESAKTAGPIIGHALQFQKEIEYEFEMLVHLLRQIKMQEQNGRHIVVSKVENNQLEDQIKKLGTKLEEVSALFGVKERQADSGEIGFDGAANVDLTGSQILATAHKPKPLVTLTKEQRNAVVTVLEGTLQAANELALYGIMANALNWEKLKNQQAPSAWQKQIIEDANARTEKMMSGKARGTMSPVENISGTFGFIAPTTHNEMSIDEIPMPEFEEDGTGVDK